MGSPCRILVYVNGAPIFVPERVEEPWAFRGALGLRRSEAVAFEASPDERLTALDGFSFEKDQRFVRLDGSSLMGPAADEETPPGKMPWEDDGDAWKKA